MVKTEEPTAEDSAHEETEETVKSEANGQSEETVKSEEPKAKTKPPRKPLDFFFVEVKTVGSVGRQPESMQTAFSSLMTRRINAKWIKEEEACVQESWSESLTTEVVSESETTPDHTVFVLDSFDGKAYNHLLQKKRQIFGPLTVHYSFCSELPKRFRAIPEKTDPFPTGVFSQCLRLCVISISGFEGDRKQELIARITQMCGTYLKDFTKRVTHLVTDSVRTKKYQVAKAHGLPVLSSQWIDHCWNDHQNKFIDGSNQSITSKYELKTFSNLLVSVSKISTEERDKVKTIVEENGGKYSGSLKLNVVDSILLLRTPEGEKFKYAQLKGVPCLDVKWLYDSHEKGYALPEDDYLIGSPSQTDDNLSRRPTQSPVKGSQSTGSGKEAMETASQMTAKVERIPTQQETNDELIRTIGELTANRKDETFLDNVNIHITGYDRPVFDAMRSAFMTSGAMVYNDFKDLVDYVIYGPKVTNSDADKIFAHNSCRVVTHEWLLESLREGEICHRRDWDVVRPGDQNENDKRVKDRNKKKKISGPLTVISPKACRVAPKRNLDEAYEVIVEEDNHRSLSSLIHCSNEVQWRDGSAPKTPPKQEKTTSITVVDESTADDHSSQNTQNMDEHSSQISTPAKRRRI